MYQVAKRIDFCIGHRLIDGYEGPCAHVHGHNLTAEIVIEASRLDPQGMVVDFTQVKAIAGRWIKENWDHGMLVNIEDRELILWLEEHGQKHWICPGNPTMENLSAGLYAELGILLTQPLAGVGGRLVAIRLWETSSSVAEYRA